MKAHCCPVALLRDRFTEDAGIAGWLKTVKALFQKNAAASVARHGWLELFRLCEFCKRPNCRTAGHKTPCLCCALLAASDLLSCVVCVWLPASISDSAATTQMILMDPVRLMPTNSSRQPVLI